MSKFAALIVLLIILAFCAINGSGLCMLTQVIHQNYFSLRNKSHVMMTSQASRDIIHCCCLFSAGEASVSQTWWHKCSRCSVVHWCLLLFSLQLQAVFSVLSKGAMYTFEINHLRHETLPSEQNKYFTRFDFFFLTLSSQSWQSRSQLVKVLALWSS